MALKIGVLAVCLLIIAKSRSDHQDIEPGVQIRHYGHQTTPPPPPPPSPQIPCPEICKGTKSNKTIDTPYGKVHCLVPTLDELIDQLNKIGGYNRHYVAITLEEAEKNFDNLLPKEEKTTVSPGYRRFRRRVRKRHGRVRGQNLGHLLSLSSEEESANNLQQKRETKTCLTPTCRLPSEKTTDGYRTCPACQRCRKLDDNLFPVYVNEVTCDDTPSGYSRTIYCTPSVIGQCKQKNMTIDVLSKKQEDYKLMRQEGTDFYYLQEWKKISMEIRSCCECYAGRQFKK